MKTENELSDDEKHALDDIFKMLDAHENDLTESDIDELFKLECLHRKTKGIPHEL